MSSRLGQPWGKITEAWTWKIRGGMKKYYFQALGGEKGGSPLNDRDEVKINIGSSIKHKMSIKLGFQCIR